MIESQHFLIQIFSIFIIAITISFLFQKIKLPPILGYLLTGLVVGPHALGIISNVEHIHELAEIGIFFLMLTIGLEMTADRFKGVWKVSIFGGSLQIIVSILVCIAFSSMMGWSLHRGFFLGSVIALSSTAVVLKFLEDHDEMDTKHGKLALSILLFQDFAVVPLVILLQAFFMTEGGIFLNLSSAVSKSALFILFVACFAKWILPKVLERIVMTRNQETFFVCVIMICLGVACLSYKLGLSFAIGAFFAGVMLANTDFNHHFAGQVIPFRHIFVSIFFISMGLLLDVKFLILQMPLVLTIVLLVLGANFVLMTGIILLFRFPLKAAIATGLILSQVGEFSFLLVEIAKGSNQISDFFYQLLISTIFLTMFLSPVLFKLVPFAIKMASKFSERDKDLAATGQNYKLNKLENHVIICGYGPTGKDLADSFTKSEIPFMIVDFNVAHIREAKNKGYPAIFGDASNLNVLKHCGIEKAKAVIVSFPDPIGIVQLIKAIENLNEDVILAVRTKYLKQMPRLYELGADIVVMDEWEANLELHRKVLSSLGVSSEGIIELVKEIQSKKEVSLEEQIMQTIMKRPQS